MSVSAGTRLGPYEIIALLGAGGMGEVYRARDTRLDRTVAVKVSREQFSERFEREARAIAALNHPHICHLYDVGTDYLVMEYVDGQTLAERMAEGPVPFEEALPLARQIAEALEAAHEKGIVHRDLKPANIKLTANNQVKVLDFGLAKAFDGEPSTTDPTISPTLTLTSVRGGMILGTAGYMSPEQARGATVDKRTDIWAFGVVLFELLAGRRLFEGETISDILAAVLRADFDWKALPPDTPAPTRRLLRRCLERDRKRRLRDIGDALVEIDESRFEPAPASAPVIRRHWLVPACAGILLLSTLVFAMLYFRVPPPDRRVIEFDIHPPEGATFGSSSSYNYAISPDGRKIVMAVDRKDGHTRLYLRLLETQAAVPLGGTDGATLPFWAPDSRWLGFFANSKLMKIDTATGVAQQVCDAPGSRTGAWNKEGIILFANFGRPLQKVAAFGGAPSAALPKEENEKSLDQRAPQFLPDGKHFLFSSFGENPGTRMGSLDGGPTIFIMPQTTSPAFYAPSADRGPGFLLFVRQQQLIAQPFDVENAKLLGDAVPVASPVGGGPTFYPAGSSALLLRRSHAAPIQMVWMDRFGKSLGKLGEPGLLSHARISPDSRSVAATRVEANNADIWLHDLERRTATRFTLEPGPDLGAQWSPDGQRLAYYSVRGSQRVLAVRPAAGVGEEKIVYRQAEVFGVTDWSHDGRWLVVMPQQGADSALLVPASGEGKPVPVLHHDFDERDAQISPDGQWLLYSSSPGGRREIFVQSLPESVGGPPGGGRWQISTSGGRHPAWRADGKEILYIAGDGAMTAVPIESGRAKFQPGMAIPLFSTPIEDNTFSRQFDVSPDGQRFLLFQPVEQAASEPLTVILNWQSLLKK